MSGAIIGAVGGDNDGIRIGAETCVGVTGGGAGLALAASQSIGVDVVTCGGFAGGGATRGGALGETGGGAAPPMPSIVRPEPGGASLGS